MCFILCPKRVFKKKTVVVGIKLSLIISISLFIAYEVPLKRDNWCHDQRVNHQEDVVI